MVNGGELRFQTSGSTIISNGTGQPNTEQPDMSDDASNSYIELRQSIDNTFNLAELRLLCADVGIEYEHLPGETRPTKIIALLDHVARQNRQAHLLHRLRELRPQADWPTTYHVTRSGTVYVPPPLPERDVLPEPGPLPPGSRLLHSRNPLFTGRADNLHHLADNFLYDANNRDVIITQTAVAVGMGGIGKTQLAVEFAHRYGRYFPGGVFWLSFAEAATIPSEVAACGGPVGLDLIPGFNDLPLADQVQMVQRVWHEPVARLLIFDNCEEEKLLAAWRPQHGGCHVLVTSRRQQWDPALGVSQLRLDVLPRKESVALLRRFVPDLAERDADAIAAELGDLPLALHLAGSFLATYGRVVSPTAYLNQLRDKQILDHASMLGRGASHSPTSHDLNVARTFAVSYERLDSTNETDILAIMLLERVAFLAPGEPVPDDLRRALALADEADDGDQLQLEDAWRRLIVLGFLDSENDGTVRLHRLLALFTRTKANDPVSVQRASEKAVVSLVQRHHDGVGYVNPLSLLLPHLRFVTLAAWEREEAQTAHLCSWFGHHLRQIADYSAALPYHERALTLYEQILGPDHSHTARSLGNLGILFATLGQLAKARTFAQRALTVQERTLGPDHPDIAQSLNNLGYILKAMGRLGEALSLYERALSIRERTLGPNNPQTAISLGNIGTLFRDMGDLVKAQAYFERALDIHERILGSRHPDTGISLGNLGSVLHATGNLAEAYSCYARALIIHEQSFGPNHPTTGTSLDHLGILLTDMGDYEEAKKYLERALNINQQVFGSNHAETAESLCHLASLLHKTGQFAEAQKYLESAVNIQEQTLGYTHLTTATSLYNLGYLLKDMGQLAEAQPYFERALAVREQILGPTHPRTINTLLNLGKLLHDAGHFSEAQRYLERILILKKQNPVVTKPIGKLPR